MTTKCIWYSYFYIELEQESHTLVYKPLESLYHMACTSLYRNVLFMYHLMGIKFCFWLYLSSRTIVFFQRAKIFFFVKFEPIFLQTDACIFSKYIAICYLVSCSLYYQIIYFDIAAFLCLVSLVILQGTHGDQLH